MDDYVIEEGKTITNDAGTFRVLVLADPEGTGGNPREEYDGHAGTIVVKSYPRHITPQEDVPGLHHNTVLAAIEDTRFRVVARWLRLVHGASVVLPLYNAGNLDAPRLAPGTGAEDEDADPGNYIGVVFDTRDGWERLGITLDSPDAHARSMATVTRDDVIDTLRTEVLQYNAWAHGEMTSWRIDRTDKPGDDEVWEVMESAGGFYTAQEAREDGTRELENIAAYSLIEHIDNLHAQALIENEGTTRVAAERALAMLRAAHPEQLGDATTEDFDTTSLGSEILTDVITDLFHLAYRSGQHPEDVVRSAMNNWHAEEAGEEAEEEYDHSRAKEDRRNGFA